MHKHKWIIVLLSALSVAALLGSPQSRAQGSLPSGWTDQDVGSVGKAGSAGYANGTFTVTGAGSNLFSGTTDAFHFAYQPASGDATIVARIVSTTGSTPQAGVMIRETLNSGATYITPVSQSSSVYQAFRTTTGGSATYSGSSSALLPYWVKLVRSGSTFAAYVAGDGVNWVQVGSSQTISMAQNVYIGLAVTSQSTSTTNTATFDNVSISTAANPAPVITGVSATTASVGEQVAIYGSGFGASQGSSQVLLNNVPVTINTWSSTSISITIPTGASSGYLAVSVAPSMNDSNPVDFTVETNPLPTGWLDEDVGVVGKPGSAGYTGVFTVAGAGASLLYGTTDGFHFAYQSISGDATIVARIVSTTGSTPQAGIMIRETLTSGAKYITAVATSSNVYQAFRTTTGGSATYSGSSSAPLPYWVKLVRSGSTFTAYVAADGVNWVQVGTSQTINMAQNAYVGLAVTSGTTSTTNTATFDNVLISTAANPAPMITGVSATTASVGQQVVISGSGFGAAQGSSVVLLNNTAMTVNSWSNTSITITVAAGATSGYLAVSVAPSMNSSNPVVFTVEANPLPTSWLDQDVGAVGKAGSASYSNGVFTISGAGTFVINAAASDAFHFAYQQLSGDGTIVARVVSDTVSYGYAGVMIRETLTPASTYMMAVASSSVVEKSWRTTTGSSNTYQQYGGAPLPYWVKVVRSGSTFSAYAAPDGINWVQVGSSQTINMAQNVYIGLIVTSDSTSTLGTATFDNVSVSTTANPAPLITSVSATTASVGQQVVISGSGFGAAQGSSVVLLNGTAMTINSWSASSITITIAAGATSGYLAVSVAPSMNDSNPVDFTVETNPLPTGWLDDDVGLVGKPGSAGYTSGAFTISGAGASLTYGTSDAFHFAYQQITGDATIVARVVSASNTYAQAGVMFRESLDPASQSLAVLEDNGYAWGTVRAITGGSITTQYQSAPLPYWVKVVRKQNSFTGYMSPDGISWTILVGPVPIDMAQSVYVGLAVTSGSTGYTYTATFDNVAITTSANPAPQITNVSATSGPVGSQVVISGSGFGAAQGSSVVLLNDSPVTINSWSATSITTTIPTGATSGYIVVVLGPSMVSSNPVYLTITSQPLPSPWLDQDVGVVGKRGNATYANGVFTVQAAGTGVSGQTDSFHFAYQTLATNGYVQARVTSLPSGAQGGVMMRETLDSYSAELFSYLIGSSSCYCDYMNSRAFADGLASQFGGQAVSLPFWVRVIRSANQFSAYYSQDGSNWAQYGSTQTITTAQTIYVGLGASNNSTSALATVRFDNVSVGAGSSLPNPAITGISPTSGAPGQAVTVSGTGFGATQGTGTVQFNGATATVSSWADSQIVVVVSDQVTTGPVSVTVGGITAQGPTFSVSLTAQLSDSLGHPTSYVSSVSGGSWLITNAQGSGCSSCTIRGNIQNQYDANGNLLWTTDAAGNVVQYGYDSSGNVTTQFIPLSFTSAATTTYTYNSFGEVLTMTDPLGNVTTNTYDPHGNLLTVTTPQPKSGVAASVTHFAYNSLGELTQITDPLGHVTNIAYNSVGLIASITDPQSNVTSYGYDSRGNRTSVTDALNHSTTFAYDSGNRLTQITYPDTTTASFTYDVRGRRTSATDQNGKTTTYAYDGADRLTSVTDAATNVTQYAYDTENNLTSITDANNHTTSFAYDAFGRVTETTFPSNLFETYQYDADNNLTSKTDRKGQTIQYVYDALNRLTQKSYPDSSSVQYTYDLVGKVMQVNDPTGTFGFSYDNMGRLTGTSTQYAFLAGALTTAYSYDAASNRTGFTAPDSSTNTYSYDTLNRLTTLANSWAGSFGFSYDALSRRTQMTRPNNVTTNYSYDNLSRLLSVLHQLSGSTIDGATYTVDNAGNRTAKTDNRTGVATSYGYDAIYQLLSATQGGSTTESYTYDPVGNRLSSLGVSPYSYNPSNEMVSTPTAMYVYDSNGNLTSKTDSNGTTNYAWDYENRLTRVTLPGSGGTVSFKYDPFGRRIEKVSSSATSIFAYDGDNLIEEVNATGAVVARYSQGQNIDEPLAISRSGATSFYEADGLGSVTSLTAGNGSLAQTYTFDSFGKQTAASGALTNPFQYTARESDPETGLYYYRARYYDPTTGRFLSQDPWDADPLYEDSNLYKYVENNALNFTDPLGLYRLRHGTPAPSPGLDKLLTCMDTCVGEPIFVTYTTNGKHQDPGHAAGTSVDIRPPANRGSAAVFCCAGQCGAKWGIDEGSNGGSFLYTQGYNYHLQLFPPHHPSPKAPNAIPQGCAPGACFLGVHYF